MKLRSLPSFRLSLPLATAIAALLGPSLAYGLTYSWSNLVNGTPVTNGNWSGGESWSAAPVSAADTTLSFGMTYGSNSTAETNTLTNDVASPFQLNVLTFAGNNPTAANGSNVATVNIAGSPLNLVLNGATTPVVNLNSNRSNGQGVVYNVQSNVALAAGTLFTGNGTATFNFSGQLSGSAFTKSGTSTLTLSGANNYTGNTTLSAGSLVLANNSALSSGALNITGDSRIGIASGFNISNVIDRGTSTVTYFYAGTAAGTATYSGALTGSGTINIANSGSGNNTTILDFTNAGGFTGNVAGATGNANGADYFRFSDIGDGGNFTFNKSGNRGGVIYNGTSAIEFDTRQIALGTSFGGGGTYGLNGNGIPQNAFQNNATNAAHTVTFNSNMSVGTIASSSVFHFDGSNTGDNTFAGTIGDASSTNTLGIGKWGAGKWVLTGSNSYEGNTIIANGTLSVNAIDVAANNQPLGKGSLILLGYTTGSNGTLEFTGSALSSTTDKQIVIGNLTNNNHGGGGALLNNGTGSLTFTATTFNNITGVTVTTVDRTLTLGGTNIGANTISGTIQDNVAGAAQVLLAKADAGRWILTGSNTYTGATSINGGALEAIDGVGLPTSSILQIRGGVFQSSGTFGRNVSTAAGAVNWSTSSGGFAARGGDLILNLNGGTGSLTWNGSSMVSTGQTLVFGSTSADSLVDWQNSLNLGSSGSGQRTISVIDNSGSTTDIARISGAITNTVAGWGIIKEGAGTLQLTNSNSYTGTTTINAGTLVITGATQATNAITFGGGILGLDIASSVTAASATVDFTGQTVTVIGTPTLPSYTLLTVGTMAGGDTEPTLSPAIPGYELDVDGNELRLISTGTPVGYTAWQAANSTTGGRDEDHDNDGVDNGTEHFLGGTGNTTGFTALPGVVDTAGMLSVTWTKDASYSGVYATDYIVETSTTLTGPWTPEDVPPTPGANVTITGDNVTYTFPGGPAYTGKRFARLKVTGP